MDLDNLKILLAVLERGSVQRAAADLKLARSTVRSKLARLDRDVGSPLLTFGPEGARPTPAGEVVAARAQALIEGASQMVAGARATQDSPSGVLRVIQPAGLDPVLRAMGIHQLRARAPGIRLEITEAEDPLQLLGTPFELMLHFGAPPDRPGWFSRVMFRIPIGVLASPAYLQRAGTPSTLRDLDDHTLLGWWGQDRCWTHHWPTDDPAGHPVTLDVASSSMAMLAQLSRLGAGLALLPLHPMASAGLVQVLGGQVHSELVFRALSPTPERANPKVRALLASMQAFIDQMAQGGGESPHTR